MNRTLFAIRSVFFLLCGAAGWLVCYSVREWDDHRGLALAIGFPAGAARDS